MKKILQLIQNQVNILYLSAKGFSEFCKIQKKISGVKRILLVSTKKIPQIYKLIIKKSFSKNLNFTILNINDGEKSKNINNIIKITDYLSKNNFTRDDLIISLGGGVVGDLSGFVSSIFKRGIKFIQIPTSLLSQVDSSIGGKTGINNKYGKNLIGTFFSLTLY